MGNISGGSDMTTAEVTEWWRAELGKDTPAMPVPDELTDADWSKGWE